MHVYQCPQCELRFAYTAELKDHLEVDHPDFVAKAGSVTDDLLAACHCHHPYHRNVA